MAYLAKANFRLHQGSTFYVEVLVKNALGAAYPLTGAIARAMFKQTYGDATPVWECTTANGRISIDTDDGIIGLLLDASTTANATVFAGVHDMELELTSGAVYPILGGTWFMDREVTR